MNKPKFKSPSATPMTLRLAELASLFLKLGIIGFGGPPAHIAMANDEAVLQRQWLTPEQFTEGLAICEMLPGPASTQMGIYIGYVRAGQLGALVSGVCFIAPAFLIVVALSWGYFRFQGLPQIQDIFLGIAPMVTAIILAFCWKIAQKMLKDRWRLGIAIAVLLLTTTTSINVFVQFILAGLLGCWWCRPSKENPRGWVVPPLPLLLANLPPETLTLSSVWGLERIGEFLVPLTLFFLKVGSFIFGGGLVIIPLLEFEVVEQLHWLTRTEFINGVAIGQLSPGPVVLTAAFVGYKVAGILGATVSTIAIFAPSFAFIMLAAPLLLRIRQNPWIQAFLQGVTPAVLGAISAATIPLLQTTFTQAHGWSAIASGLIGVAAFVALIRYKLPTWQLVPVGAGLGLLMGLIPI
ncbi:MAG: chromate efflux transporter [Acaryochloris sp. RU_4_1]|nr:chromate efflux transporter [Acaryochloris sp. SU_5_25]NJM65899.1 chromate efflux transporter [Acaryochloris sp. RU_4_1]NJR55119.1 chromate efflux transporter [Acaryochloris sp. CRU_2_0]